MGKVIKKVKKAETEEKELREKIARGEADIPKKHKEIESLGKMVNLHSEKLKEKEGGLEAKTEELRKKKEEFQKKLAPLDTEYGLLDREKQGLLGDKVLLTRKQTQAQEELAKKQGKFEQLQAAVVKGEADKKRFQAELNQGIADLAEV